MLRGSLARSAKIDSRMAKGYVEAVVARGRPRFSTAVFIGASLLLLLAWVSYYRALEPIPWFATEGYKKAVRASRFGSMGWALFYAMLGLWLYAKTTRGLFGLPSTKGLGSVFRSIRLVCNCILLALLSVGSCEPGASTQGYSDDRWLLGGAAGLVWLLFAADLVPLVRNAAVSLRVRASSLRFRQSTIDGSEVGAVRLEGVVAAGERTVDGDVVYRHVVDEEGHVQANLANFVLESRGARVFVDTVAKRTLVVPAETFKDTGGETAIAVGDTVEVWGELTRAGGAYRGQPSRITAGSGRLYIFQGSRQFGRRLMRAALIEVLASAAFVSVGIAYVFYIFDLYLFLI